ncbi:MAG: helix-turn-helix transcriptional regulator [Burkholderiales bacterium]|nr:helix-turn-helix transcriptional regulator [Burkholderiales bacterium]
MTTDLITRRKELGEFLKVLRERCVPEAFGFPGGQRRRARGLRREEVAQLAAISPTWYTWIEQGREVNVSAEALTRLSTALKLTRSERAYLFEMAGRRVSDEADASDNAVPDILVAMLADIATPAYLMGPYWDLLGWNPPAGALFAGWLDLAQPKQPNLLRYVFLDPSARTLIDDWEVRARRIAAEFRADCRTRFEEPALQRLVAELTEGSLEFGRFWKQHDVLERQGGQRNFRHPSRGLISYQQVTLHPVEQTQLKLVILKPMPSTAA